MFRSARPYSRTAALLAACRAEWRCPSPPAIVSAIRTGPSGGCERLVAQIGIGKVGHEPLDNKAGSLPAATMKSTASSARARSCPCPYRSSHGPQASCPPCSRVRKGPGIGKGIHDRRKLPLDDRPGLFREDRSHDEDGSRDAGGPEVPPLLHQRHAEHMAAQFDEPPRDRYGAVAVRLAFTTARTFRSAMRRTTS